MFNTEVKKLDKSAKKKKQKKTTMVWGTHGAFRGTRAGFEIQICVLGMVVHWVIHFIPVGISFLI